MLKSYLFLAFAVVTFCVTAQETTESHKKDGYVFTELIRHKATPVKNQYRTSTCWSFGTASLLESELLRTGKGEYNLSEMYVVRQSYLDKAKLYMRMHGNVNFAPGGSMVDILNVWKKYGLLPEEVYSGMVIGEENHIHSEMDAVLKAYMDALLENPNRKLSPVWEKGFKSMLDAYLGELPNEFTYNDKKYTPESFAKSLNLNIDDYVQMASFTHHPFYKEFILEIPDNWAWGQAWNISVDELTEVIDFALHQGYTVAWAADISEKGFSHKNGVAIVPETNPEILDGMERGKWEQLTQKEKDELLYSFKNPVKEKAITQEMRQDAFDNFTTTDDHAMHIVGIANDQEGAKYYIVKNSWGTDNSPYGGYLYASEAYVQYKTMSILVNKNAISRKIRGKMAL